MINTIENMKERRMFSLGGLELSLMFRSHNNNSDNSELEVNLFIVGLNGTSKCFINFKSFSLETPLGIFDIDEDTGLVGYDETLIPSLDRILENI